MLTKVDKLVGEKPKTSEEMPKELEEIENQANDIPKLGSKPDLEIQSDSLLFDSHFQSLDNLSNELTKAQTIKKLTAHKMFYTRIKSDFSCREKDEQLSEYQRTRFFEKCRAIDSLIKQKELTFCIVNSIRYYQLNVCKSNKEIPAKIEVTIKKLENLLRTVNNAIYSKNIETIENIEAKITFIEKKHDKIIREKYKITEDDLQIQINSVFDFHMDKNDSATTPLQDNPGSHLLLSSITYEEKSLELVKNQSLVRFYGYKFKEKVTYLITKNDNLEAINSAYTIYFILENIFRENPNEARDSDLRLKTLIKELDTAIIEAHETLDVHRGFKKILLDIVCFVKKLFFGASLFENVQQSSFFKTNSNKDLEQLKKDVVGDTKTMSFL